MAKAYVTLNYTGTRRYWKVPSTIQSATITYKISGGGGGAGGWDSPYHGSSGDAGDLVTGTISVKAGDLVEVGVGGYGHRGSAGTNTAGGARGSSLTGFNGGFGGQSGGRGWSGSGGGGGGATVIKVNGQIVAVAGGGAGGGGGGHYSYGRDTDAGSSGYTYGTNGAHHPSDGGGGGAGGGGYPGGAGGSHGPGDTGGYRGKSGTSLGTNIAKNKGAAGGKVASGSSTDGSDGYANLTVDLASRDIYTKRRVSIAIWGITFYSYDVWSRVKDSFVKVDGSWRTIKDIFVKVKGVWKKTFFRGSYPVVFESSSTGWGGAHIINLTSNTSSVNEGGSFTVMAVLNSYGAGTTLNWEVTGIQAADLASDSSTKVLSGSFVTTDTSASTQIEQWSFKLKEDAATEGKETAKFTLTTNIAYPSKLSVSIDVNDTSLTPASGGCGCCVVSTALESSGQWTTKQKMDLVEWCEKYLHDNMIGECFRRGYQVVGSWAVRKFVRKGGILGKYANWAFTNGTNMVQGRKFSLWSVPNSIPWIIAFMAVGAVVSKRYATKKWMELYK